MSGFIRSRLMAFKHAFAGWHYVITTQRNAWIHAVASIVVFITCFWLQISLKDWALIIIAVGLVWIAEFINTGLEAITDLAMEHIHPLAKVGKDVGAAGVLLAALTAVLIGLIVLGPPLLEKINALMIVR